MPKMFSFDQDLLDRRNEENLQKFELAMKGKRHKRYRLASRKERFSRKYDGFFYELPNEGHPTLKQAIEYFPQRMCEDGYSFPCNFVDEENIGDVQFLASFLVNFCQSLKSIEFRGQIGPQTPLDYYIRYRIRVFQMYAVLIEAFKQMPNLETISFYSIRLIPDDPVYVQLIRLFISNDNLVKILLPYTNGPPPDIVRQAFLSVIEENPKRGKFICYRWNSADRYSDQSDFFDTETLYPYSWTETFKMRLAIKQHFKAQKRLK